MQAVKEGMRDEISSLKRELASDREAADERLVKKLKLEKAPTFKRKTHEKQFLFNEEVASKIEGGSACLSETPPAVEKAKTLLEEGMKLVRERQKLIRMADRSEHGWATVDEYLEDELADDSDDEKRMQKAEFRAGRKLKATAAKNAKNKGGSMQKRPVQGPSLGKYPSLANAPPAQSGWAGAVPGWNQQVAGISAFKWPGGVGAAPAAGPPLQGPCFNCGKTGHVKKFCPLLQAFAAQAGK
jgi:hypothetical protein